ncbi:hypothetical protein ABZ307_27305 [Streptomyces griseorubiginosus]|uniref:hypothetical protein n=1 Tax=Streptomyces griseorubiginosus TaxID=67304 RepID=UPI0033ACAE46
MLVSRPSSIGGACADEDSPGNRDRDEWINRLLAGPNGDGDFHDGDPPNQVPCLPWPGENICASLESFHPKNVGATGYAQVMDQALTGIGCEGG